MPAQFRVLVTRRPKYACRACEEGVAQAPAPARLIEGGLPTEATVAHVLVSKYADHLPLYRQAQIYARQGIDLDRSTLADWVGRAAWHLRPVHERLLEHIRASTKIFADETTAPVLDPDADAPRPASFGLMRETIGLAAAPIRRSPSMSMRRTASRSSRSRILPASAGVVQVDGYAGYRALAQRNSVRLAFCWSHVRRRFYELAAAGPAPIAVRRWSASARSTPSKRTSVDAIPTNGARRDRKNPARSSTRSNPGCAKSSRSSARRPSLPKRSATRFALDGLTRFVDDGRVEIDSNAVERAIRPIAMRESLCAPSSSICKHWKRVRVDNATRATFTGHRRFHRLRRQVVGPYLMRGAGNNLHGRKDARFDQAPNRMVCNA